MDIKDYLGQYVKSTSLKLGGESAIQAISDGAELVAFETSLEEIQNWGGETAILKSTEGQRTVILSQDDTKDLFIHGQNINFYKPLPGGGITLPNGATLLTSNNLNLTVNGSGHLGSDGNVQLAVQGDGSIQGPLHGLTIDNGIVTLRQLGGAANGSIIQMSGGRNLSINTGFTSIITDSGIEIRTNSGSNSNLGSILIKNGSNVPGQQTIIVLGNEPDNDPFGGAPLPKSPAGLPIGALWADGSGDSATLRIVMPMDPD